MARDWHDAAKALIEAQRAGPGAGPRMVSVTGGATPDQVDDLRRRFVGKTNDAAFCGAGPGQLELVKVNPWGGQVQYDFAVTDTAPGALDGCDFNELP